MTTTKQLQTPYSKQAAQERSEQKSLRGPGLASFRQLDFGYKLHIWKGEQWDTDFMERAGASEVSDIIDELQARKSRSGKIPTQTKVTMTKTRKVPASTERVGVNNIIHGLATKIVLNQRMISQLSEDDIPHVCSEIKFIYDLIELSRFNLEAGLNKEQRVAQ